MLDSETKRRIDTARDILVGKLPDPKSQIEQITIALIYKFMDDMDKESEELGGKVRFFTGEYSKYSWSNIFDTRISGFEMFGLYSEAITRMSQNKNIPQLFRDIFKNAYLPYRDPETLKSFLKVINDFRYDHSEKLGDAFEYLLSVMGSQGDAGQFRTPRHIIDFIVKVIDPDKNETILDPACGSAGFLISAYKHILNKYRDKEGRIKLTPDERKRLVENFIGYDISPDMVRLSLVNLYLHGFQNPHIFEYDALTSEERWNESYDVIMANPPFMTPKGGIKPHKRFSIQANRSEVLFVDYIAEHLTTNGRAGIIVPEGIIFQSANAYQNLRKMLLDKYLWAVVSLPAGVFNPYSGVKTSILLLDKNISKKTKYIIFIKAENDGFGLGAQRKEIKKNDLHEALIILKEYQKSILEGKIFKSDSEIAITVPKDKIEKSGNYGLSGDRYLEVVQSKKQKFEMVELESICEVLSGYAFDSKKFNDSEGMPLVRIRDIKTNSTETRYDGEYDKKYIINDGDLIIGMDGEFNTTIWRGGKALLNQRVCKIQKFNNCLKEWVYLNIKKPLKIIEKNTYAVTVKHISSKQIEKIKIPLPPLEVQKEIVAKIDEKQKIINNAKKLISSLERERTNSREVFERLKCEEFEFEKVCTLEYGASLPERERKEGDYPVMGSNGVSGYHKEYLITGPAIIVGRKGSAGEVVWEERNCYPIDTTYYVKLVEPKKVLLKYIYFILKSFNLQDLRNGAGIPGLNRNDVYMKFKIPLPNLETQKQLIARFDKQEDAIKANKALIEVMQENINEKISEIWSEDGK